MSSSIASRFFEVRAGTLVSYEGKRHRITHLISVDTALGADLETGELSRLPIELLKLVDDKPAKPELPRDLSLYSKEEWAVAQQRLEMIKLLIAQPSRKREEAEAIAEQAGVHVTTLYRWLRDYLKTGTVSGLVPSRRGRKAGARLLSAELENVLDSVIEDFYLKKQRPSPQDVIEVVETRCRLAKILPPHPNTVRNRLKRVPEIVKLKRRGKREEAKC